MYIPLHLSLVKLYTNTTSNHTPTLVPRGNARIDLATGYPYNQGRPQRWKIDNLPGGLRYVSADVPGFLGIFEIQANDPNADGFAGRWAGGGRRDEIFGNMWVLVFLVRG